jgi:hypothetical protein
MIALLERFSQKAGERRQGAAERYRELLDRADAPTPGDEERLAECLSELGLSPQDVQQHISARANVAKLEQQVKTSAELDALSTAQVAATAAVRQYARDKMKSLIDALEPHQLDWAMNALSVPTNYTPAVDADLKRLSGEATNTWLAQENASKASAEAERKIAELRAAYPVAFGA